MVQKEAKKKTRTYIASAVLLSILIVSLVCVIGLAPLASGSPAANGSLSDKELHPNDYASGLAAKLKSSFNTTFVDGNLVIEYPIEYGGAYIDHSNNLHIVLSKYATNSTIDTYRSIMGDPDVIFENADFPLSYLYAVQDAVGGVMVNFRIDVASVNEITNRLQLNLEDSTKQRAIIEYLNNQVADFDESCITFLGPNPITAGLGELNPPMATPESNGGFLGTNIPMIYGAAAIAIIAVTIALACYLAFVRHGEKP
jgi:hypothetical protein